ncbi:hypothetical protein OOJ91_12570 [Micromonospora lupini]|uniref:hypothetical protein n=1 Tax=Micromonospora lupini TaxID=285679 RepID=UPI0022527799|nr:hypothetical protein [Micromonospora lupini]MCX5066714.1 hypothetical protein [Micromonospora lupini]
MAALAAVPALVIAVVTWRDQQAINRSQLEVNQAQVRLAEIENKRYEGRYAARVSFSWADSPPGGQVDPYPTFLIYNPSPVPIMRIAFEMDRGSVEPEPSYFYGGDLDAPPCSILTVRVIQRNPGGPPTVPMHDWPLNMRFLDTVGWWRITTEDSIELGAVRAPVPLAEEDWPPLERTPKLGLEEVPGTRKPAPDCGEGG